MSLSFLFGVNSAAILTIVDACLSHDLAAVMWLYDHKIVVLAFGVVTAWGHVQYAKYHGVYDKVGPAMSPSWWPWFMGYCVVSAALTILATCFAYMSRPSA